MPRLSMPNIYTPMWQLQHEGNLEGVEYFSDISLLYFGGRLFSRLQRGNLSSQDCTVTVVT